MSEAEQRTKETLLHFGGFTLNLERRGLYRGQERVRLTSKPLETLIFLVENRREVVEKQTLLDAVWKGTFVTEDVLVQSVREIRRALGDDKDNPLFIQTVPRQGYRFVGKVSSEPAVASPPALTMVPQATDPVVNFSRPVTEVGVARPNPLRMWLLLGLIALAPVVLFVSQPELRNRLWSWFRPAPRDSRPAKARTQTLLTTGKFSDGKPALSPDGKNLLFISSDGNNNERAADGRLITYGDLCVRQLSTGNEVWITNRENPSGDIPVFTADGNHVVFSNYNHPERGTSLPDLYRVFSGGRVNGDTSKPFIREASGAGFSPDGQWVAYTKHLPGQKALWLSAADKPEKLARLIAPTGFTPRWSWDGKWIAYTTSNPNGGLGDLWIVDAESLTGARNLTREPQQMYGLTWTPDGQSLIFASKRTGPQLLWRVPVAGGPVEPVSDLMGDFAAPSMSRVNNILVFSHYRGAQNLRTTEELQGEARDLSNDEYHEWSRLSPSGLYVASVMQRPDLGEHLYVTDLKGNPTRLTEVAAHHPCWVKEGRLAYLRPDKEARQTQLMEVDISDLAKPSNAPPLHTFPGQAEWLAVDPQDGTRVAVVLTLADATQQIVLRELTQGNEQIIDSGSEYANLRWSPDGSTLAWSAPAETGHDSNGIWLTKLVGQPKPRRIVANGYGPVWRGDGLAIYFSRIGKESGLWEIDLNTEKVRPVRSWREVSYFDVVGQRIVFCQLGSSGKSRVYSLNVE